MITAGKFKPGTVSLLGGGQLGKMFIMEAMRFDLKVRILDPDPNCPCAAYAHEFVCGSLMDEDTVLDFCSPGFPVTIEIEHVNINALKKLKDKGIQVLPDPDLLELIQDKGLQKQFYKDHQIPTSDFILVDEPQHYIPEKNAFPFVQKTRKGGYDGKGVLIVNGPSEWPKNALVGKSIIEEAVKVEKELGVLVASDGRGNYEIYEPVEMVFDPVANLVDYLVYPSQIHPEKLKEAKTLALHVAEAMQIKGLLAVELFLTSTNELLVNEVAPRTHNSGHAGIEAALTSQFEQQARLMCGLPLGSPQMLFASSMINIIGPPEINGEPLYSNLEELTALPGVYVHLYGKKEMKPGRKMGHVTILALSGEDIYQKTQRVKSILIRK